MPLTWFHARPVRERVREDGRSGPGRRMKAHAVDIPQANRLSPDEAVSLSRSIRAQALTPAAPDSTAAIRADRDHR